MFVFFLLYQFFFLKYYLVFGLILGYNVFFVWFVFVCFFVFGLFHNILSDIYDKKKPFKQFEKKEPLENNEIIITTLKKIPEKQYIIPIKDGAVAINRGGIHVVKLFQASGNLKYDKNWYFNNLKIDNPFDYKGDYYYLIRNVNTNYEVYNINVVTLSELLFKVQNSLIVPKYTYEEVDELYKEVTYGNYKN